MDKDIVERLLARADDSDNQELDREAAGEIVRLRMILSSCKKAMEQSNANGGRTDWRHMIAAITGILPLAR
jgi:hypothetical protein